MSRVSCSFYAIFVAILVLSSILEVPVSASNFAIGDLVEVCDSAGLKVRDSPAGNYITTEPYGSRGIIRDGPRSASLGGVTYTWWYIEWKDGVKGWSAEGYPGGVYYIKKVPPEAPMALSPGSSSEPGPIIDTLTPTLQWQASFGADYYALAISEYPYGSSNIIYNPQQIYGTSHTVPSGVLQPGKKYRWNLQAHSSGGWSPVSNTLYFQTSGGSAAEIVSYYPSNKITVRVNQEFTLSVTFKNTGSSGANFYAGATIWDSSGNQVQNLWSDKIYVSAGSQGYASWTASLDTAGEYWLQFGIWNEAKTTLLAKAPSPSQNLIKVVEVSARIDSYYPGSKIEICAGSSFTLTVYFTNTGGVGAYFYAGVTIWDSNGGIVFDRWSDSRIYLEAGQQGSYSWPCTLNNPGEYWLQFGVWDETKTRLYDKKPSPSQNLIKVKDCATYSYTVSISGLASGSTTVYLDGSARATLSDDQSYTFTGLSGSHTVSVDNPVSGGSSVRYYCSQPSITISGQGSHAFTYMTQYYLTMQANPSDGGTVSPSSGWYNSGQQVQISASPANGWAFQSWTGSGSGSYTGTSNPATITMNGPVMETANFQQVVTPSLSIQVSADPGSITTSQSSTITVTVTSGGSAVSGASVSLSCNPSGPSLNPPSGTTGSDGRFTATFSSSTTGTFTITATASKSGYNSGSGNTQVTVSSTPQPFDFSISVSPSSRTVTAGQSTTYSVIVSLVSGTAQTVSLSLSGQNSTMSYEFRPSSGSPTFTSTLTISTTGSTPANTYILTITGTGGGLTRQKQITLIVETQPPQKVTLTLYVHEGSKDGPLLSGVRVTGYDGAGKSFDQTTDGGYVVIEGTPGRWHFTISKEGYKDVIWDQDITETCTKHAYFTEKIKNIYPPTVETGSATEITTTEATLNGIIVSDGGESVDEMRFDWGTTSLCSDGWTNKVVISGNSFSFRLTGLKPGTRYYFRAWAHNSKGWSHGDVLSFVTLQLPKAPDLISPKDGETFKTKTITFSWSSSSGALEYQIEIIGPTSKLEIVSSTSYKVTLTPGSYTWRVRAHGSTGWSDWSPTRSFTISLPALAITLISPFDGYTADSLPITLKIKVTSEGSPVEGAKVTFVVENVGQFPVLSDSNGYASYIIYKLESGEYNWYAEAEKEDYQSAKSQKWSFTYKGAPEETKVIFKFVSCDVWYSIEGKVFVSAIVENPENVKRDVNIALAIQDPDGNWHHMKERYETISLEPKSSQSITLSLDIPIIAGKYKAKIIVWTNEPYKIESKELTFEITVSSYDQQSFDIKNRWENAYLISISREELEENHEDIVETLKKPAELTAMMKTSLLETFRIAIKEAASEFLKEKFPKYPEDVIMKIAENLVDGNYREIPADALKAFLTEEFKKMAEHILTAYLVASGVPPPLAATLSTGIVRGISIAVKLEKPLEDVFAYYMISPMIESRVSFAIQFMEYTVAKLNKVNFIVKEVQDRFEIYLISYEYNFDGNKVDKIANKAILYYVGTYERLPQVFLKKMRG